MVELTEKGKYEMIFEVKVCNNTEIIKKLFAEYSKIQGAESCFVSFDKYDYRRKGYPHN